MSESSQLARLYAMSAGAGGGRAPPPLPPPLPLSLPLPLPLPLSLPLPLPADPQLVGRVLARLKSDGVFDQFRKECIADVDTKPAYQNLRQRVESAVAAFLNLHTWNTQLNKNQLREKLRKHLLDSNFLDQGVERIVDQVVNPKIASVFIPQVEEIVYKCLGLEKPDKKNGIFESESTEVENLLPNDLESVSPESVESRKSIEKNFSDAAFENRSGGLEPNSDRKRSARSEDSDDSNEEEFESPAFEPLEYNAKDEGDSKDSRLSGFSELTSHDSNASVDDLKIDEKPCKMDTQNSNSRASNDSNAFPDTEERNVKTAFGNAVDEPEPAETSTGYKFNDDNASDVRQYASNVSEDNERSSTKENADDLHRESVDSKTSTDSNKGIYSVEMSIDSNESNSVFTKNDANQNDDGAVLSFQNRFDASEGTKNKRENRDDNDEKNKDDTKSSKKSSKEDRRSSHGRSKEKRSRSSRSRRDSKSGGRRRSSSRKDSNSSRKDSDLKSKDRNGKTSNGDSRKDSQGDRRGSSGRRSSTSHRSSKRSDEKSSKRSSKDSAKYSKRSDGGERSKTSDKEKSSSRVSSKSSGDKKSKSKSSGKDDRCSSSGKNDRTRRSTDRDSNDGNPGHAKTSSNTTLSSLSSSSRKSKSSSSNADNNNGSGGHQSSGQSDNVNIIAGSYIKSEFNMFQFGSMNAIKRQSVTKTPEKPETPDSDDKSLSSDDNFESIKIHSPEATMNKKPIVHIDGQLKPSNLETKFINDKIIKKPKCAANMQEALKLMKIRKKINEMERQKMQEAVQMTEMQNKVPAFCSRVYSDGAGPELKLPCSVNCDEENLKYFSDKDRTGKIELLKNHILALEKELKAINKNGTTKNNNKNSNFRKILTVNIQKIDLFNSEIDISPSSGSKKFREDSHRSNYLDENIENYERHLNSLSEKSKRDIMEIILGADGNFDLSTDLITSLNEGSEEPLAFKRKRDSTSSSRSVQDCLDGVNHNNNLKVEVHSQRKRRMNKNVPENKVFAYVENTEKDIPGSPESDRSVENHINENVKNFAQAPDKSFNISLINKVSNRAKNIRRNPINVVDRIPLKKRRTVKTLDGKMLQSRSITRNLISNDMLQ